MENGGRLTVNDDALNTDKYIYCLRNPLNINYNDERSNQRSMGWSNLIGGSRDLHSADIGYVNVVNTIANFVEPTLSNNIITNETILTQYRIKKGIQIFRKN